ncbi:MAG: EAL domain-containing protein, partial [Gammaproteobacteria bacterium]|nr:EAL domain-containing protein [Gammaproteobacteria bacterium]
VESRYPGMPILMDFMEPTNRQFSEAVELALQEGTMTDINPTAVEADLYQVMQLLQEVRFAWSQQISWFRVFVANRMGAFGDPKASMKRNLVNRGLFARTVKELLDKLDELDRKNLLGLQQSESLIVMRQASKQYEEFLERAVVIYLSDHWRSDIPLLQEKIQPNLSVSWYYVSLLEERFKRVSEEGLSKSQGIAILLSKFIWLFVGALSCLVALGYAVFAKSIRKPLQQMTSAMEAEARGQAPMPVSYSEAEEILQLQNAFDGMREQVYSRQTRLESILDNAAEGIVTINSQGIIESANLAAQSLFGYSTDEMVGKSINILMLADVSDRHGEYIANYNDYDVMGMGREVTAVRCDKSTFPMSIKVSEFYIGEERHFTAMVDDVSERHAVMQSLRHMAEHDSLTGLYNRQYFMNEIERSVENAKRSQVYSSACLYIDLDNFKYVNDTMGHLAGDRLLLDIAEIFSNRIRKGDVLSRLGGDEFAILLVNVDQQQASKAANYLREKIADFVFSHEGKKANVGCSIGVAMMMEDINDKEDILARADIACHMAKRAGRNKVHVYQEDDQANMDNLYYDIGWSRRIKTAIENDQFVFEYQPIFRTANDEVGCYEVLLRMVEIETGNLLLPSVFLPSADRFGLMVEVDCWVITNAVHFLGEINKHNADIRFAINLSAKSLTEDIVLKTIQAAVQENDVNPENLIFEITEDVAISDISTAISFIQKLSTMGCRTALDDFGVGYSSFSYLKELPVDYVKIDGSFIKNFESDKLNHALVKSMNDICHTLGKLTVAEFVETEKTHKLLKKLGVDFVQGFYTGKPSQNIPCLQKETIQKKSS